MKSVYIYPTYRPDKDATEISILNIFMMLLDIGSMLGAVISVWDYQSIFNIKSDLFIFHWVETIRFKRFGLVQVFVFVVGVSLLKFLKNNMGIT